MLLTPLPVSLGPTQCPDCGPHQLPYPLSTDASTCGHPRYAAFSCHNGSLHFLSATAASYAVRRIDAAAATLVLAPPPIPLDACHSPDLAGGGFLLDDESPFNISARNTVILLNCSDSITLSPLNCSSNSICRDFEAAAGGGGCGGTLCCHYLKDSAMNSRRIRVRVGGCTAYTCLVGFKNGDPIADWNYGIELQWLPPY